jgi:hypothetical protein
LIAAGRWLAVDGGFALTQKEIAAWPVSARTFIHFLSSLARIVKKSNLSNRSLTWHRPGRKIQMPFDQIYT